jgi:predicted AAA+ superfamily ATPase
LDEIQTVEKWEEVVSSLLVDTDCDIYITGSNSKLLFGELATLIAGRYIKIHVYPFTLSEAKELTVKNGKFISNEELFQDYLRHGGLPMRFSLEEISIEPYLSDTYDAVVVKDIIQRNKIKDTNLLNFILNFLMDNIANPFSARSITAALIVSGIKTTVETVIAYRDIKIEVLKRAENGSVRLGRGLKSGMRDGACETGFPSFFWFLRERQKKHDGRKRRRKSPRFLFPTDIL